MTVDTTRPVEQLDYMGPGSYPFNFKAYDPKDIAVYGIDATGLETKWLYATDYDVALSPSGGTVTTYRADGDADYISIEREVPLEQPTDWVNQGPFSQELLERDLDRIVMQVQQIAVKVEQGMLTVWRGDWAADTEYRTRDMVRHGVGIYMCIVDHTSSTDFQADLGAGYWSLVMETS